MHAHSGAGRACAGEVQGYDVKVLGSGPDIVLQVRAGREGRGGWTRRECCGGVYVVYEICTFIPMPPSVPHSLTPSPPSSHIRTYPVPLCPCRVILYWYQTCQRPSYPAPHVLQHTRRTSLRALLYKFNMIKFNLYQMTGRYREGAPLFRDLCIYEVEEEYETIYSSTERVQHMCTYGLAGSGLPCGYVVW